MIERIFDLPAHPLFVHLPVVLLPLAALLAVLVAVKPDVAQKWGTVLLGLSVVSFLSAVVATMSGEGLEEILGEHSASLESHAEWGDRVKFTSFLFMLLVIAFVVVSKRGLKELAQGATKARSSVGLVLSVLVICSALLTTYCVIQAGHSGATSAWEDAGKED